jgi:serralysin
MPAVTTYNLTGNLYIDSLLDGVKWAGAGFTYSFPNDPSFYGASYGSGENTANFEGFNATQQAATRAALNLYASVANLSFTAITETSSQHADLRFGMSDIPGTAWAYFPSTNPAGGDAWFNNTSGSYDNPLRGNYAYLTLVHETGHALGLKHPHEGRIMPQDRDSLEYTVMSYRAYVGAAVTEGYPNETWSYPQSLMLYDIAALQHMYGANFSTNSGNTTYSWSPTTGEMYVNGAGQGAPGGNRIFGTVWDGGGSDTYDFSNYLTPLKIDLRPGSWSTTSADQLARLHYNGTKVAAGTIANALLYNSDPRSLIESAIGGFGNDTLMGNQTANQLAGSSGADTLAGGDGNDVLDGGDGIDTVVLSGLRSQYGVSYSPNIGSFQINDTRPGEPDGQDAAWNVEWFAFADRVYSSTELATGSPPDTTAAPPPPSTNPDPPTIIYSPQELTLTGTGGNNTLRGYVNNDKLYGLGGNDVLVGEAGGDLLSGGTGVDTVSYTSATGGVLVDLALRRGYRNDAEGDTYASIENITGSPYDDALRGNDAANVIKGIGGNDTFLGRGGNDTLVGGAGDDILHGQAGRDILTGASGRDTFVFRSISESRGSAKDVIKDFTCGADRVDVRNIDANTKVSGNQAFSFIGKAEFSGKAGQLKFSGGVLSGDVNGDRIADFQVDIPGRSVLSKSDFYL